MSAAYSQGPALLDTACLLWAIMEPERLSRKAREICELPAYTLYVSPASLWEIILKAQKGQLPILDPVTWWNRYVTQLNPTELPVRLRHMAEIEQLPHIHKDPFDRLLIAQAKSERMPLVTPDAVIRKYKLDVIW